MEDSMYDPDDFQYTARSTVTRVVPKQVTELIGTIPLIEKLEELLENWSENYNKSGFDPLPTLISLSELMEKAIDQFLNQDPDPLDDRHPHRTHPQSAFGNLLKGLFRNDDFMSKLTISYLLGRDQPELSTAAARLLLNCVPGLDSSVIFETPDDFVPQLFIWATESEHELLRAYSMGLLSSALEVGEAAAKYRQENSRLIPIALRRLAELRDEMEKNREREAAEKQDTDSTAPTTFPKVDFHDSSSNSQDNANVETTNSEQQQNQISNETLERLDLLEAATKLPPLRIRPRPVTPLGETPDSPPKKRRKTNKDTNASNGRLKPSSSTASFGSIQDLEASNSRWNIVQPYIIGTHKVFPLSIEMHQRLVLQYLGPSGEYQDLLVLAYEGNALDLIFYYINLENTRDVRLTFDALKYLTCLLVHRKFALEFVSRGGIQALLKIPRACLASVGVVTCFYYLSYNVDVMERVCQLDQVIIDELVDYAIWCLEHSHESGMASASMFFSHGLFYKVVIDRFDQKDGLRRLYNYVSTLSLLQDVSTRDNFELSEEQMHTSTQSIRNASATFRAYCTSHLYMKLVHIRKNIGSKTPIAGFAFPASMNASLPLYKSMQMRDEDITDAVTFLTNLLRVSSIGWRQIEDARRLGLIKLLFNVLVSAEEWTSATVKCEIANNCLEILRISSCVPRVQLDFCELLSFSSQTGEVLSNLLDLIDRNPFDNDPEVQICALEIITNCSNISSSTYKHIMKEKRSKNAVSNITPSSHIVQHQLLEKVWTLLRNKNVIMILNKLIRTKQPLTAADHVRAISCKALLCLSRSEPVRQILSKLPLLANNELQSLTVEPVAPGRHVEHNQFCKNAQELLEIVSQRKLKDSSLSAKDLTQEKLWKSHVIANTRIKYNEKELLQLMHEHLIRKGLTATADQLIKEANLPNLPASRVISTPVRLDDMPVRSSSKASFTSITPSTTNLHGSLPSFAGRALSVEDVSTSFATPSAKPRKSKTFNSMSRRLSVRHPSSKQVGDRSRKPVKQLDGIVTDYLRAQHSNCSNPLSACPPFSLFYPHHCPISMVKRNNLSNVVKRYDDRSFRRGTWQPIEDEKFVYSRFRSWKAITDHDEMYTCSAFSIDDEHLIVGMFTGDVHWLNMATGTEESHTMCHTSALTSIEPGPDGATLLTSSAYIRPLSSIWRLGEVQEHMYDFADQYNVKFANLTMDRIIGTNGSKATIFDTETGSPTTIFNYEAAGHRYQYNQATFSPSDTLILNDGILWDIRDSAKYVHQFDMLSPVSGGVFHPHGNEIIINSEVWDARTFRLLHSVPALDQCKLTFNSSGNIIYATIYTEFQTEQNHHLGTTFRTFSGHDYSAIATHDLKKPLLDFSIDHSERFVSCVEKLRGNTSEFLMSQEESQVRVLEIGKQRDLEDDMDDGDGDDDSDSHEGSDSDDMTSIDDSSSSDSYDGGVFDAIERLAQGSNSSSESGNGNNESESSGWETASNDGEDDEDEEGFNDVDDAGDSSDDNMDESSQPDEEEGDAHPSSSSTALNPHLRRQNRNRDGI